MDIVAYGETYNRAMQGIEDMLLKEENPMASFKKSVYPGAFQTYVSRHLETLRAIEAIYQEEKEPEVFIDKLSDRLVSAAQAELDGIAKKGKRNEQQINYNMLLAVFVFPAMLEQKGDASEPLTDAIIEKWNATFKTSVGKADYAQIEAGFHRKFCYITTAVCESQGKPDNCYELELLRDYRDQYLLSTEEGEALVKEYYNIAPTIVTRIGRQENSHEIYCGIWENYLSECIHLIEEGKKEDCCKKYMDMVCELKGRYMA